MSGALQVAQQRVPRGALDDGDDRRRVRGAHDQISLPVTGLLAAERLGRSFVDQRHARERTRASCPGVPAPKAVTPPEPQDPSGQLAG